MSNEIPGYFPLGSLPQQAPIVTHSTGWPTLDRIFKPYAGQFVTITGKVGHGKSTFIFNLLANLARIHGMASHCFVPENESFIYGKLERLFGGDELAFQHFVDKQCFIQSCRHEFYDDQPRTLQWMLEKAEKAIARDHIEVLLIDPWNYLEKRKPKDMLMTEYINDCLHDFASFARHFEITAILVAHPTKHVADGVVGLYDIEGSAAWANKTDSGLCVSRQPDGTARITSTKVRESPDAGELGTCNFHVDAQTGKFTPLIGVASDYAPKQNRA